MSNDSQSPFIKACSLTDLETAGSLVRQIDGRTLALFVHEDQVFAVDNRCPHMGFPLNKGSVKEGILTCLWHNARFELCSGGTFDLFADDVRTYPVEIREGGVWVDPRPQRDEVTYQKARLRDGLEQNIRLVMAKSLISLLDQGADSAEILGIGGLFGAIQRNAGWRDGLTILTAMGNTLPYVSQADKPLALYHGMLHVADNVSGQGPHFELDPISADDLNLGRLKIWLRQFAEVRDRDGVERVILTAIENGFSDAKVADLFFAAVTDHYYLDGGHSLDFINKAFELLDLVGWSQAKEILPSLIPGITAAARLEESSAWRRPIDLVLLLEPIFDDLLAGKLIDDVQRAGPLGEDAFDHLIETLLDADSQVIAQALADALKNGAGLTQLSLALSYAAALRIARFHTSNEFGDWIAVLHTFTTANATHQLLKRAPSLEGARSLWHTAMHLYLNRFFNQPAARLPTLKSVADLSDEADALLEAILTLTDQRQQVEQAAAMTYRYLSRGHTPEPLIQTLSHILLREDGEFHSYQMLEAGIQLYHELRPIRPDLAPNVLVAVARYLAGHAPTDRATTQTYRIAARLYAGEALDAV